MDLAAMHTLRRSVRATLEAQQAAEAEVIKSINETMVETHQKIVAAVADWLWESRPADRVAIEKGTGISHQGFTSLKSKAGRAETARPDGFWSNVGHTVGFGDQAKFEKQLVKLLTEITDRLLEHLDEIQDTPLGRTLIEIIQTDEAASSARWAEHVATANAGISQMMDELGQLQVLLQPAPPMPTDNAGRTGGAQALQPAPASENDDDEG